MVVLPSPVYALIDSPISLSRRVRNYSRNITHKIYVVLVNVFQWIYCDINEKFLI